MLAGRLGTLLLICSILTLYWNLRYSQWKAINLKLHQRGKRLKQTTCSSAYLESVKNSLSLFAMIPIWRKVTGRSYHAPNFWGTAGYFKTVSVCELLHQQWHNCLICCINFFSCLPSLIQKSTGFRKSGGLVILKMEERQTFLRICASKIDGKEKRIPGWLVGFSGKLKDRKTTTMGSNTFSSRCSCTAMN